jgi:hypothetical protein
LCEHSQLSRCSSGKSARARRKLLDKQAWKILKKLYPDSTQLESCLGECLHCTLEEETCRKNERDKTEQAKLERKKPLSNEHVRRFYTRTRGIPVHCLRATNVDQEKKMPASTKKGLQCPLVPGIYHVLPREWCHAWRKFIKTGESEGHAGSTATFPPPDAASLLCDAHRLPLLPPHLEAYLYGDSPQLLVAGTAESSTDTTATLSTMAVATATAPLQRPFVPGQDLDRDTLNALRAAGLSQAEVASQLDAMRNLEVRNMNAAAAVQSSGQWSVQTHKELLARENHSIVEILTQDEMTALEETSWPDSKPSVYLFRVAVDEQGVSSFSALPCRECDATGRPCNVAVRNRARGWVSAEKTEKNRARASLEY